MAVMAAAGNSPAIGTACTREGLTTGGGPGLTLVCRKKGARLTWQRSAGSGGVRPSTRTALPAGSYDKAAAAELTGGMCSGVGSTTIVPPMRLDQVSSIVPYGGMIGGHVTSIDHQYYNGLDSHALRDTYDVVSPVRGRIVSITHRGDKVNTPPHSVNVPSSDEYRIVISSSCSFLTYVDLVTSLDTSVKSKLPARWSPRSSGGVDIPVAQRQVIGHIGGQTLDFAVWDLSQRPLAGLTVRVAYDNAEAWKVFTSPPSRYFAAGVKAAAVAKYVRIAAPIDGKIDYDQNGKLIGTWFKKGTNGYSGGTSGGREGYWAGHLAIAPNFVDPSVYVVSLGSYAGAGDAQQFGIAGNAPDPATVSVATGLVKFELVQQEIRTADGDIWQGQLATGLHAVNNSFVSGVVLLQLLAPHELKVEVFPGKTAAEVSAFDSNASIYTRGDDAHPVAHH